MMQNLKIAYTLEKVRVASTVVAGDFVAFLQAGDGEPIVVRSPTPNITFTDVKDGDYTVSHNRLDAAGAPIFAGFSEFISIEAGVVTKSQLIDGIASVAYSLETVDGAPAPAPTA